MEVPTQDVGGSEAQDDGREPQDTLAQIAYGVEGVVVWVAHLRQATVTVSQAAIVCHAISTRSPDREGKGPNRNVVKVERLKAKIQARKRDPGTTRSRAHQTR